MVHGPKDVLPVVFMYLVFTHMPGESYRRRLRSLLLCLRDVFRERPLTQKQATLKNLLDNSGSVLLVDREDLELSHRRGHRVIRNAII